MNKKQIGILSNNVQSPWLKQLIEVLAELGALTICAESMLHEDPDEEYDLIVVDASGLIMELAERVAWLNGRFPNTPIFVLTSSPTWRRARDVLQAGAADYMRRSFDDEMLLTRCRVLMSSIR
ncbi:MAG: response regulator [Chloroflexi bacterium]|nr:response regulator [Chloroflexota bacterium]